jgi:hypothetical protein
MSDLATSPKNRLRKTPSDISVETVDGDLLEPVVQEPFRISWSALSPILSSIALVLVGFIIFPRKPDVGLITITFFGMCGLVLGWFQWQHYQDHKLALTVVDVQGGVRIMPSRFMLGIGLGLALVGTVIFVFGGSYPALIRWLGALIGLGGAVISGLNLIGIFPPSFLQFEPEGLILGHRSWQVMVPWDQISAIDQDTMDSNAFIKLEVEDLDALEIVPALMATKARRILAGRSRWQWTPLMIFPLHYSIATPILVGAIIRYAEDPSARANLGHRNIASPSTPK